MQERDRFQSVALEAAVLVRVILPDDVLSDDPLEELRGLAETARTEVVAGLTQRRETPDNTTFLGKGKVDELKILVDSNEADVVIFDNDLSPAQTRNLEKALSVKVIDRTELILDIFASNAKTYESRLAVELAQLEYSLPRLKRMWTHLSRQTLGVGMRGPGEKQLEEDRRLAEKRIYDLRSELKSIERRKEREVAARHDHMTVSLVGYTNAGKSTLMNSLTNAGVVARDRLFATLDTRTRRWQLPNWGPVLLSDTVGFIRSLPHHLIASFKATLAEARQADLLLHVADGSNPEVFHQISAVYDVLRELGIDEKDTLLVVNKIDRAEADGLWEAVIRRYPNAIPISARSRQGLERLAEAVSEALSRSFREVVVDMPIADGRLMAYLAQHGEILGKEFQEERARIHCRMPEKFIGRIHDPEVHIAARDSTAVESFPGTNVPETHPEPTHPEPKSAIG